MLSVQDKPEKEHIQAIKGYQEAIACAERAIEEGFHLSSPAAYKEAMSGVYRELMRTHYELKTELEAGQPKALALDTAYVALVILDPGLPDVVKEHLSFMADVSHDLAEIVRNLSPKGGLVLEESDIVKCLQ